MRTTTHPLNAFQVTPRAGSALLVLVFAGLTLTTPSWAQTRCNCAETLQFGSCVNTVSNDAVAVEFGSYPDQFPASMTFAEGIGYIADLFSGRAHRFMFLGASLQFLDNPLNSPVAGTTTGITSRTTEEGTSLFWAGEGKLYVTDIEGNGAAEAGTIQLEELAVFLRQELGDANLPIGEIGGIVYHPTRGTFWGVDIVNDVYFEFDENGALNQPEGTPIHFLNPARNVLAGGAYGNSITYASVDGEDYFDIPTGSLADGAPAQVMRVFASDTATHGFGDDTGIAYPLGTALGSPGFVTGIGYVPDACEEAQHVEIMFEINAQGTTRPQILVISADAPTAASVANFVCAANLGGVALSWDKTLPYTSLEIRRRATDAAEDDEGQVVFPGVDGTSDFTTDPETLVDAAVPDGSYIYTALVTAETGALPPRTCSLTIGRGTASAFQRIAPNEEGDEPFAFGVTVAESSVVVADVLSGDATTYDLDLNATGSIEGPFEDGLTVGIAYNSNDQSLYWLQNLGGRHNLQATDTSGMLVGETVGIEQPGNLNGLSLGDITYDAAGDRFWSVDLTSNTILAFGPDGRLAAGFDAQQLPAPAGADALAGGVALATSEGDTIVLDLPLRATGSSLTNAITRTVYDAAAMELLSDLFTINLATAIGSGDASGVALTTVDDLQSEFVVSQNRAGVYKLELGPSSGLNLVTFRRGDANDDGDVNISDPSFLLNFMFQQGELAPCLDAADADNSESIDITDGIFLFNFLFRGGSAPPAPFSSCGLDPETDLACESANCSAGAPDPDEPMDGEPTEGEEPVAGDPGTDGEPAAG